MNRFSRLLGEFSRNSQRAKLTQQLNKKVEAPEANANGTSGYLIKEGKNYFDTNTSSHHHFYDEVNNELTDIENNKIELKKFPTPPKGKSIKDVNVIINIDNDNQKH